MCCILDLIRKVNPAKTPVILAWSGGRDSALTLHRLRQSAQYAPVGLLTVFRADTQEVNMHRVSRRMIEKQAEALGLPLIALEVPYPCANSVYETTLLEALTKLHAQDIRAIAYGDIFLADIRAYREKLMQALPMHSLYPLWQENTHALAEEFIALGFRAKLCCVDPARLPTQFCGREYDRLLLAELPENVDPCGENGEFHSFTYAGPGFTISCHTQPPRLQDGFYYSQITA